MKFKNISGDERWVPDLGVLVADGETVDVEGDLARDFNKQDAVWRRVDKPKPATPAEKE